MSKDIQSIGLEIETVVRETSLYVRGVFESAATHHQAELLFLSIVLLVALALRKFNEFDNTIISIFFRVCGLIALWVIAIAFIACLGAVILGVTFDLTFQQDSSFQFYLFYTAIILTNAKWPFIIGGVVGAIFFVLIKRKLEPFVSNTLQKSMKKNVITNTIPDVENIKPHLFETKPYDPRRYFSKAAKKGHVFIGLDAQYKPVTIERDTWNMSNVQIVGVPGSGKGVSAAIQLYQAILNGDSCVVLNPKLDEWAESVYAEACEKIGKKLIVIDCRNGSPAQINPLLGISSNDLNELLIAVFNLSRSGEAADFYRNNDRKGARIISELAADDSMPLSLPSLIKKSTSQLGEFSKNCEGLLTQLEEIASLSAVHTNEGLNLFKFIENGGCLLVKGSTRNESVITLLNMILVRIIQLVENRQDKLRHVSIFCDEVKYLTTSTFINSLGTVRDKNANFILAHQSLADLEVENAGVNPTAVRNSIIDNTPIKWIYKATDFSTAHWVSELCGTSGSWEEGFESESNSLAAENLSLDRRYKATEIPIVHTNIIQNLPPFCAVCVGATGSGSVLAFTSPIKVPKVSVPLHPASPIDHDDLGDELL
jgi:type IV secretory pathway TraG/TraD family ATPase VirD4